MVRPSCRAGAPAAALAYLHGTHPRRRRCPPPTGLGERRVDGRAVLVAVSYSAASFISRQGKDVGGEDATSLPLCFLFLVQRCWCFLLAAEVGCWRFEKYKERGAGESTIRGDSCEPVAVTGIVGGRLCLTQGRHNIHTELLLCGKKKRGRTAAQARDLSGRGQGAKGKERTQLDSNAPHACLPQAHRYRITANNES